MPNWTYNTINVRASNKQALTKFIKKYFVKDENNELRFDFNKVIPQPKTKEECPKEYICDCEEEHIEDTRGGNWFNWYKWNNQNWGTKWNACDTRIDYQNDNELEFSFDTAWCCPHPIFRLLKQQNPSLRLLFDWEDEGW